jgi:uncharacterized protein with GYD domain
MPQQTEYTKYAVLAQLREADAQNPQELASMWGDISAECREIDVEIEESYAALGRWDFLVVVDAPSRDRVLKTALIMERHGLDTETMAIVPTENFADIVTDG